MMCNRIQFASLPGDEWVDHFLGDGLEYRQGVLLFDCVALLHANQHCQDTCSSYAVWKLLQHLVSVQLLTLLQVGIQKLSQDTP